WKRRGESSITVKVVLEREDASLELVGPEPVLLLQRARLGYELLRGAHRPCALRVRIPIEQIRRERHSIANPSAEDVADRHAPRLADQVEAREFERGRHLRAVVVKGSRRIREHEPHLLEARRVASDERALQREDGRDRRLAAAAHLSKADEPAVAFDLDDGANE